MKLKYLTQTKGWEQDEGSFMLNKFGKPCVSFFQNFAIYFSVVQTQKFCHKRLIQLHLTSCFPTN